MVGTSATADRTDLSHGETAVIATPFGRDLFIACNGPYVTQSRFVTRSKARSIIGPRTGATLRAALAELDGYFSRRLGGFSTPFDVVGTPLQIAVWETVSRLPMGTLVSYADIARAIGRPNAARGVAGALAKTPLALFIPAHRVVGADGRIKGAEPNAMRRRLLAFEGITLR